MKQKSTFNLFPFLCTFFFNFGVLSFMLVSLTSIVSFADPVFAADLSSSHFIVRDPVIGTGGGFFSSGSFQMLGAGHLNLSGYATSANFIGEYGFLYFPPQAFTPPVNPGGGGGGGTGGYNPAYPNQIPGGICGKIADFNCDGWVDLLDLSILLFYIDKTGPILAPYDLSPDGVIDIKDISILFYYWDFHVPSPTRKAL